MDEEIYPLTIVLDDDRYFGHYLEEILLAEGFPYFKTIDLGEIAEIDTKSHPFLLFSEVEFTNKNMEKTISCAEEGAVVILMRPNKVATDALGLEIRGDISDGYICWGKERPLQFHGEADIYPERGDLPALAFLKERRGGKNVGLGFFTLEQGKGKVGIFPFNLAKSIMLTRQGNPAWKDSKGDQWLGGIRPGDLFYRISGEKWIDPKNTDIPQADFLQRFFIDQIISLSSFPLARIWYFPNMEKVSFTVVADSDQATPEDARIQADLVKRYEAVYSIYLIDKTLDLMEKADFDYLVEQGNEVALHPDYNRVGDTLSPTREKMKALYANMIGSLEGKFGIRPVTMRHHCVVWCGWVDMPRIQEEFGIKLDNCYGYPCWFGQRKYGGSKVGYVTGSGQPQRFCDEDGRLIDVFQLEHEFEDEILLPKKGLGLSGEEASKSLEILIDRSRQGHYSYLVACFHPIRVATNPEGYKALEMILSFCKRNRVPLRTLKDVAEFAGIRREIQFSSFRMDGGSFSFTVSGPEVAIRSGVTLLVPSQGVHRTKVDGEEVHWSQETLGRHSYFFTILDGLPFRLKLIGNSP